MNRQRLITTCFALAAAVLLTPATRADSLTVALTQTAQTVAPGTTVVEFDATISNPSGTDTVFLNGDGSTTDSLLVTVDDTPFLNNAPFFLAPGGSSGPFALFDVDLPANLADGIYTGVFSIQGGADGGTFTAFDDLADTDFTVDVSTPSPPRLNLQPCCCLFRAWFSWESRDAGQACQGSETQQCNRIT